MKSFQQRQIQQQSKLRQKGSGGNNDEELQSFRHDSRYDNDDNNNRKRNKQVLFPPTFATKLYASCAILNSVNLGYDIGVGTTAGPSIMYEYNLSNEELEIFLGSLNFFSIFGALGSPLLSDKYGRRWTLGIASIGFFVGVLLMSISRSYGQLVFGRAIVGIGVGVGGAIDPMYIAEISPPHCRGELVSWAELGIAVGILLGFSSALFESTIGWRGMMSLGLILPILLLIMIIWVMPESPRWLVENDQEYKARAILASIYPSNFDDEGITNVLFESEEMSSHGSAKEILGDFDISGDKDDDDDDDDDNKNNDDLKLTEEQKDGGDASQPSSGGAPSSPSASTRQQQEQQHQGEVYSAVTAVDRVIRDIKDTLEIERAAAAHEHVLFSTSSGSGSGRTNAIVGSWSILCHPSKAIQRMLIAGIGTAIIQQAVGIDSITFYLMLILKQSGIHTKDDQIIALIYLGFIKVIFVFIGSKLMDKVGRRPLLFTSLIGCAVSLLLVSMTFVSDTQISNYATVGALGLYLAFFSCGLGPANWVVVSEIFASSIRAKAMSLSVFANRFTSTLMATTFLTLSELLSWTGYFFVLMMICLGSLAFLYHYLPETNGRKLEHMSHYFASLTGDESFLEIEHELITLKQEQQQTHDESTTSEGII